MDQSDVVFIASVDDRRIVRWPTRTNDELDAALQKHKKTQELNSKTNKITEKMTR